MSLSIRGIERSLRRLYECPSGAKVVIKNNFVIDPDEGINSSLVLPGYDGEFELSDTIEISDLPQNHRWPIKVKTLISAAFEEALAETIPESWVIPVAPLELKENMEYLEQSDDDLNAALAVAVDYTLAHTKWEVDMAFGKKLIKVLERERANEIAEIEELGNIAVPVIVTMVATDSDFSTETDHGFEIPLRLLFTPEQLAQVIREASV